MLKIIEPLRFEGMLVQPTGAVEHPVMGAIDLYWFNEPSLNGYTSSFWLPNGSAPDCDKSFALKLYTAPYYDMLGGSETKNMVGAYAMFTRQRAAAAVDAAPPVLRMIRTSLNYSGRRFVRWGYSTRVCKTMGRSDGVGADERLIERLVTASLRDVQSCVHPLGQKETREWSYRRDLMHHNCGYWKDTLVAFDFGAQIVGAEEDHSWAHPETPVSV